MLISAVFADKDVKIRKIRTLITENLLNIFDDKRIKLIFDSYLNKTDASTILLKKIKINPIIVVYV